MQAEQTASIVSLLSRKPLVPFFPSKPCWTDMQSLVMSQCDCDGWAPPEGMCACLALLLYGQKESEKERESERVLTKHVNAAAERCDVRERTITLKHWNDSRSSVIA